MMSHDDNSVNFLSDIQPSEKNWDTHRAEAESVRLLYSLSTEFTKYATRIYDCSQVLKFAPTPDKLVLKHAFFCRVRYCPVCQWRRSLLWRAVMFQQLPAIKEKYPAYRWVFLTLTVKNPHVTDLRETLKAMNSAWQRMAQTKRFKGVVKGFIRTTEVTRGKDGEMMAHPHFHALLLVDSSYFARNYIKQYEWVTMWQKALRVNYEPSVYVKAVKPSKEGEKDNLDKAICETLKYSVKPSDIAKDDDGGDWLHEMTKQTLNMRFIATGGVLKGVLKPEEEVTQEEMLTPSGQDEAQDEPKRIGFRYMPHYGKYVYSLAHTNF